MKISIQAVECESASEAIQWADASGEGRAVRLNGKAMVVAETDLGRLEAAGAEFAYLHDYPLADGSSRIVTVPIN